MGFGLSSWINGGANYCGMLEEEQVWGVDSHRKAWEEWNHQEGNCTGEITC